MKVLIIVLFLTPLFWLQADVLESSSDANMFVIGLAAQRALEIEGLKCEATIVDSTIGIQTNFTALNREQTEKYTTEEPSAAVRGKVLVTIRKPASGSTPFTLEFKAERQSASESWTETKSRGVFERELVEAIKKLVERYRKTPSLN